MRFTSSASSSSSSSAAFLAGFFGRAAACFPYSAPFFCGTAFAPGPALAAGVTLPDEVAAPAALAVIVIPTALNCAKWQARSREGAKFAGDF